MSEGPEPGGETFDAIETRLREVSARPASGVIRRIVVRQGGGQHATPARVRLDPQGGIEGDRWSRGVEPDPADQVSLMDARVVETLAGADGLDVPGDNLVVDLDLGEPALPFGARLRIGTAVIELSGKLHAGCSKFRARLGDQALRWVNAKQNRARRLRGVFCRVLEAGEVAVGDTIVRLS